jgi:hypothetical protein
MYDAKEQVAIQKDSGAEAKSSATPAWAFPLMGVVGMFAASALMAVRVRRGQRSTRQVIISESLGTETDCEALLEEEEAQSSLE